MWEGEQHTVTFRHPRYGMVDKNEASGLQRKVRREDKNAQAGGLNSFREKLLEEKKLEEKRKKEEEAAKRAEAAAAEAAKQAEAQADVSKGGSNGSVPTDNESPPLAEEPQAEEDSKPVVIAQKSEAAEDYAAEDKGGKVLAHNPEAKQADALVKSSKNSYVRNPCDAKKWVVIELAQEIIPERVVLMDHEKFSSSVKQFQVLGSKTYPVKNWVLLGDLTATNKLPFEEFKLTYRSWSRFIKFRFLTHYGNEHYCTLTQIRVHGALHTS